MPHFTVVPVDGPRRGDYDNLEGLSWVDYGERAEREDSDDLHCPTSCHFLPTGCS
ncbi:SLC12A4 isoform 16 [Pongo abelii]|uniref:SLC12A4 isoform 16 n=1 Tax=Pongo abelii TaxID=9601 RepID=A0A2J8VV41_PONAB|nr:SLC12A4 isoform 16 [Pongo abelii]